MKIISKEYWQDMKNFVEQNFSKIWRFSLNQDEFGTNYAVDKHTKISVDRYIGRFLVASIFFVSPCS